MSPLLKRLAGGLSLLAGAFLLCFVLFQLLPADPVRAALGPYASPEAVKAVRHSLGLDLPPLERLLTSASRILCGDWGTSIIDGRSVGSLVWQRSLVTAGIGLSASFLAAIISLVINAAAVTWQPAARLIRWGARLSHLPAFVLAFGVALLLGMVLPSLSLSPGSSTFVLAACLASLHPAALLSALLAERIESERRSPRWRAARSLGFEGLPLIYRSLFRPVAVSWLAALVNLLSGVVFTVLLIEVTFSLPGLGTLFVAATQRADLPVLQGIVLANALFYVALVLLAEFAYNFIDPRVR